MEVYHADRDQKLIEKLESAFGPLRNLAISEEEARNYPITWRTDGIGPNKNPAFQATDDYSWGFKEPPQEKFLIVGGDLQQQQFSYFILKYLSDLIKKPDKDLAYLYVTPHPDVVGFDPCSYFVSMVHSELRLPVYMLSYPLDINQHNGKNIGEIVKLERTQATGVPIARQWRGDTVTHIPETNMYLSTSLDVFPAEIFNTEFPEIAKPDFTLEAYRQAIKHATAGHNVVGSDLTGLKFGPPDQREITNLIHLMRFMRYIMEPKTGE